jgi:hypothetical protein
LRRHHGGGALSSRNRRAIEGRHQLRFVYSRIETADRAGERGRVGGWPIYRGRGHELRAQPIIRAVTTIKSQPWTSRGLRRTASGSHPDLEREIHAVRAHSHRPDTKLRLVPHREAIRPPLARSK